VHILQGGLRVLLVRRRPLRLGAALQARSTTRAL
jgi:hypothetical protein